MRSVLLPVRRRRSGPRRLGLSVAGALLGVLLASPVARAVPADGIAIPQPTRVERFNPDQQVCQPRAIVAGFNSQLQPWADQPPAVLERLRQVQLEMTQATIRRCVGKGLLQPADAAALERQLGMQSATPASPAQGSAAGSAPSARP